LVDKHQVSSWKVYSYNVESESLEAAAPTARCYIVLFKFVLFALVWCQFLADGASTGLRANDCLLWPSVSLTKGSPYE
jgi:hypothetical protein